MRKEAKLFFSLEIFYLVSSAVSIGRGGEIREDNCSGGEKKGNEKRVNDDTINRLFKKRGEKMSTNSWVRKILNKKGEGYIDTGIKLLISVVIGSLLLTGLYSLFSNNILPMIGEKITEMFSNIP